MKLLEINWCHACIDGILKCIDAILYDAVCDTIPGMFQVIFWGVREMKRAQFMSVNRPRVDIDCCYPVTPLGDSKDKTIPFVESTICKNAKSNPNFHNPIALFDVVSSDLIDQ